MLMPMSGSPSRFESVTWSLSYAARYRPACHRPSGRATLGRSVVRPSDHWETRVVLQDARLLEPVRRSRIYEHIVQRIQALIAEGKLKPGDQLPPERVLAETFRGSRPSGREALGALGMSGLIEGRQGGGTFVRTPSVDDLVQPLASALLAGKRELVNVLEVREILEPALARLAAERATPEQIAELEAILERQ